MLCWLISSLGISPVKHQTLALHFLRGLSHTLNKTQRAPSAWELVLLHHLQQEQGEFCSQTQTPAQPRPMGLPHQPCEHCCGLLPLLPNVRIASKNSSHQKWHSHVKVSKKLLLFELTHLFSAQPSPLCSLVGFRMPHSPACAGSCV